MPQRKAPASGPIPTYNLTGTQQAIARGMTVEQKTMAVAASLPGESGSAGSDGSNIPVLDIAPIPDYGGLQGSIVTISTGIIFICLTCKEPDLFTDKPAQKPQEPYVPPNSEAHPGAPAKWEP